MGRCIMGNEESNNSNVEFDNDAIEVTDNWTLYYAYNVNGCAVVRSAFISQPGNPGSTADSVMKLAKNLMIHRHPCILQYVSSWSKNGSFYLVTEEVKPLAQVLGRQSALQICVGLHSILKALTFLHENAQSSHNNLCYSSIYVTPEGVWKLGGLDYLKKFSEVTQNYLQEIRAHRYEKAVPPEEDNLLPSSRINPEAIDQYAFGVLVEEVLKKKAADEVPHLVDFISFCKKNLCSSDPSQRSKLSEILTHQFFNHDFIKIHKFLFELPLKLSSEKENFFRDLTVQLSLFPEELVASQLASLLLSRIVILDETAQKHLLPMILQPKKGEKCDSTALFSEETFRLHIIPKLLQMFCVRDASVRLTLLDHFSLFCNSFTMEQLKYQVLPELLTGIKDVSDELVSKTLKALADLVLILGASTVIGGKRGKLFTDGRPKAHNLSVASIAATRRSDGNISSRIRDSQSAFEHELLPERLSPDGGEDTTSRISATEREADAENWSDWESQAEKEETVEERVEENAQRAADCIPTMKVNKEVHLGHRVLPDITTLDIKSNVRDGKAKSDSGRGGSDEEVDFFRDMEPVISKPQAVNMLVAKNKFDMDEDTEVVGTEWAEDWDESDS